MRFVGGAGEEREPSVALVGTPGCPAFSVPCAALPAAAGGGAAKRNQP